MGYPTKVQLIQRKKGADRWYINFPTAVAEAMDFEKGEIVNRHIQDRANLVSPTPPCTQVAPVPIVPALRAVPRVSCCSSLRGYTPEPHPTEAVSFHPRTQIASGGWASGGMPRNDDMRGARRVGSSCRERLR